jgi:hypothetical protein
MTPIRTVGEINAIAYMLYTEYKCVWNADLPYCDFEDECLPEWDDQTDREKGAWRAAARCVLRHLDEVKGMER